MTDVSCAFARSAKVAVLGATCVYLAVAGPASAQVVESATLANSYSYSVGGLSGSDPNAPGNVSLFLSDNAGGFNSDMGLQVTSALGNGSFSFLQNGYCVGSCSISLTTDVTFTLTNMGTSAASLRFDSLITPGHLGQSNFFGATSSQRGNFLFDVTQDATMLYRSAGINSVSPPFVEASDGKPYNNMLTNTNLPDWNVLDWSATPLNLNLLTIGAGQTSTLTYHSTLTVATTDGFCLDTADCLGYQVAFGDPRTAGGPTTISGRSSSFSALAATSAPNPAVGALFAPYTVTYQFVPQGSPLPPPPLSQPPMDYDIPYKATTAVPEPAAWALMLLGFAAIGSVARNRRRERPAPHLA